jgi:predicted Ser/Thr protein kinase
MPPSVEELAAHFPQLEILGLIGKGGMGAVYKARQRELDRIVALKILPPGIGDDPAFASRFAREARALAKLGHPNIVTLYEFGRGAGDGPYFFLMEYVDGVNLRQLLLAERVAPREALEIVPQICDALQYAHDQGIVHRDIKPENILIDRRGRVKVADFGLAKIIGGSAEAEAASAPSVEAGATDAGKIMGTPSYMAPEQVERPAEVDHRADIYALGVVFYQMLTGELPGSRLEPPSRKVRLDVRLDEVVLRALERQPELRYQQASILKTQVETIAEIPPPLPKKVPAGGAWHREKMFIAVGTTIILACFFMALTLAMIYPRQAAAPLALLGLAVGGLIVCGLRMAGMWPFPSFLFSGNTFSSRNCRQDDRGTAGMDTRGLDNSRTSVLAWVAGYGALVCGIVSVLTSLAAAWIWWNVHLMPHVLRATIPGIPVIVAITAMVLGMLARRSRVGSSGFILGSVGLVIWLATSFIAAQPNPVLSAGVGDVRSGGDGRANVSIEPPKLQYLAWLDQVKDNPNWQGWRPDGPLVPHTEMALPQGICTGENMDVSGTPAAAANPRFICLWISDPSFDTQSVAKIALEDASGKPLEVPSNDFAIGVIPASAENSNLGWISASLCAGNFGKTPTFVMVKLKYSGGPWTYWDDFSASFSGTRTLDNGVLLIDPGQGPDGKAFIGVTRDATQDPGNEQFDFVAVTKDGRELNRIGLMESGTGKVRTERCTFDVPLDQVKLFHCRKRPILSMDWYNVVLQQPATFAPVVEFTLPQDAMLDFDTGKQVNEIPKSIQAESDIAKTVIDIADWMEGQGLDVGSFEDGGKPSLSALDMKIQPLAEGAWNSLAAEDLQKSLGSAKSERLQYLKPDKLPATYAFQTRQGGSGILQITGSVDNPAAVKIRYKMLREQGRDPKAAAMDAMYSWLGLIDGGQYAQAWEEIAPIYKDTIAKEDAVAQLKTIRQPLGKVVSRELCWQRFETTLPDAPNVPSGNYFEAEFHTRFSAGLGDTKEKVAMACDPSGVWKVAAYAVLPREPDANSGSEAKAGAMQAVQSWLGVMDDGQYAQAWEQAAPSFQKAGTQDDWVQKSKEIRAPLGKMVSRKVTSQIFTTKLPGIPDGTYFVAEFHTQFGDFPSAKEQVAMARDSSEAWQAIAYLILPDEKNAPGVTATPKTADEQAAVSAAESWLAGIDAGKYAESWTEAEPNFRSAVSQVEWISDLTSVRSPLGALLSRSLKSVRSCNSLPGAPAGHYVVMQFDTSFANSDSNVETVTFAQTKDGKWEASGYFIK